MTSQVGSKISRRTLLGGAAAIGAASVGSQLVNTKVSFGQQAGGGTLIVIFMRGGVDGLSVLVPGDDPHLLDARPDIAVPAGSLLQLDRGFGLHPQLKPLHDLWTKGQFTAVPAVSTPDLSRSHFQAQDCLERGGSNAGVTEGWLDRTLDHLGDASTFQAVSQGTVMPRSLLGDKPTVSLKTVDSFKLWVGDNQRDQTTQALASLYSGFDHPLAADAAVALDALDTAHLMAATPYQTSAAYPEGALGSGMKELARLIKGDLGLRVACVDAGGWDMHTWLGNLDDGAMKRSLTDFSKAIGAFASDIGEQMNNVTIVGMTEFGRRVEQNHNRGTDHGHGSVALLIGGGLAGRKIHGEWPGLAPDVLDRGDVPGANDFRNILAEVVSSRLGVGADGISAIFPGHRYQPIGVMA